MRGGLALLVCRRRRRLSCLGPRWLLRLCRPQWQEAVVDRPLKTVPRPQSALGRALGRCHRCLQGVEGSAVLKELLPPVSAATLAVFAVFAAFRALTWASWFRTWAVLTAWRSWDRTNGLVSWLIAACSWVSILSMAGYCVRAC